MFSSRQTSPRGDAQSSRPDQDSDSASATRTDSRRKRPRLDNDREDQNEPLPAACDQCRVRKVRCDRLQPECSNCRKGGFECNSSNTLKRVNHMKQLRDDFSDVLKQLNEVGHTLGVLTEITRQITARPCSHAMHPPYCPPRAAHTTHDALPLSTSALLDFIQQPGHEDRRASTEPRVVNKPLSVIIESGHGGERLYSYPAPLVLMKSLVHQARDLLAGSDQQGEDQENRRRGKAARWLQDSAARATLQQKIESFPFNPPYQEFVTSSDMSPITTPPRLMVNLFVGGYLRNINTRTPIFNESELHHAIDAHYSDKQLQDSRPRALILNNIILLELSLEIQTGRASCSTSRVPNDDILPSFLRNCDRAIGNLDAFMAPSIVSLQALMTLTLAAQEFYSDATAERVCQAACQVGRLMGIHRSKDGHESEGEDAANAQRRLFRILYAMDKQRVFMTGQPCDLHLFDSDQHIGPRREGHPGDDGGGADSSPISDAFDDLMTIWEEIYLALYSSRAARAGAETRVRQVCSVIGSMDRFAQTHAGLLLSPAPGPNSESTDLQQIELLYGYQVSQILVLRCDQDGGPGRGRVRGRVRDLARSSLRLILEEARRQPLTTARFTLLTRLFRWYPMVAFTELISFHLTTTITTTNHHGELDAASTAALLADVSLLRGVCEQVGLLQYDKPAHIFYTRLSKGLIWALEMLEALVETAVKLPPESQAQPALSSQQQQCKDNNRPPELPSRNSQSAAFAPPSPTPDVFDATVTAAAPRGPPNCGSQDFSRLRSLSRHDENEFGGQGNCSSSSSSSSSHRHGDMMNFGFFTPDSEGVEMILAPLSPVYQPGGGGGGGGGGASAFAASHSQLELVPGTAMSGNGNWGGFSLDFLQGAFPQGNNNNRWD